MIVLPDFTRAIDLPGAGPCPRPVEIDRAITGFDQLVALRVYAFAQGIAIDGESEDDEVFIVAMRGEAEFAISQDGVAVAKFHLAQRGGRRALYMPPGAAYRLTALTDCDIAYARAHPRGAAPVRAFGSSDGTLDIAGHATGMDLALFAMAAGEPASLGSGTEQIVHLRADGAITAVLGDEALADWSSAAIGQTDAPALQVTAGSAEILLITASRGTADTD